MDNERDRDPIQTINHPSILSHYPLATVSHRFRLLVFPSSILPIFHPLPTFIASFPFSRFPVFCFTALPSFLPSLFPFSALPTFPIHHRLY